MSEICGWLHECLCKLPLISYPFQFKHLPKNGIYFFYEIGEIWGHGGENFRIVRVGTHRQGNFKSRIMEHYLLDDSKMNFNRNKPKPSDRSIFRKNIGRALLNIENDNYLEIWDVDYTYKETRENLGHLRNIKKEKETEFAITENIRDKFSFRFLVFGNQIDRIGSRGVESSLIGTTANCPLCKPSNKWLGNHSPIDKIRKSGLWQVQHLNSSGINEDEKVAVLNAVANTLEWLKSCK